MSDISVTEGVLGVGGLGAIVLAALKWSGSRNITSLDLTIKALSDTIAKLTEEVQKLRESHIGLAKDVGALQQADRALEARIEGQGKFWHDQFEGFRGQVETRLAKAKR